MPEDSVIITGSGSVSVDLPEAYSGITSGPGRKKFHDDKMYLKGLKVNDEEIRPLGKHDKVVIITTDKPQP